MFGNLANCVFVGMASPGTPPSQLLVKCLPCGMLISFSVPQQPMFVCELNELSLKVSAMLHAVFYFRVFVEDEKWNSPL